LAVATREREEEASGGLQQSEAVNSCARRGSIERPDLGGEPAGHGRKTSGATRDRGARGECGKGGKGKTRVEEWGEGCWQC